MTFSHETLPLVSIDPFANVPSTGNPAALCLVGPLSEGFMQSIAIEMNLSQTAFMQTLTSDAEAFSLLDNE